MGKKSRQKDAGKLVREVTDHFVKTATDRPPDSEVKDDFREAQKKDYGARQLKKKLEEHHPLSPKLSGGDVDAAWTEANTGEETVAGDAATPDQDVVEELGEALGVVYQDNEPLKGADKITERDRNRWELDPASSEDYEERKGSKTGK